MRAGRAIGRSGVLAFLLLAGGLCLTAGGQAPGRAGRAVEPLAAEAPPKNAGVFIGINVFPKDPTLEPLEFAVNDAVALAYLNVVELRLIPPQNCFLCLSGSPTDDRKAQLEKLKSLGASVTDAATKSDILVALRNMQELGFDKASLITVSVSSHGLIGGGVPYVIPSDGVRDDLDETALKLSTIELKLEETKAGHRLLLIDACQERVSVKSAAGKSAASAMKVGFAEVLKKPTGQIKVASCKPNEFSYEDRAARQGAFTHAILEALRRGAAPRPEDSVVDLEAVLKAAAEVLAARPERERQSLFVNGEESARRMPLAIRAGGSAQLAAALGKRISTREGGFTKAQYDALSSALPRLNPAIVADQELLEATRDFAAGRMKEVVFVAFLKESLRTGSLTNPLPTVVLSLRSVDELLDDAGFIGDMAGQAFREQAESTIDSLTGGKGLAGIDRQRGLGLSWNVVEGEPEMPVVFLPIADEAAFRGLVETLVSDLTITEGLWSATAGTRKLYARMSHGYCFVSPTESLLTNLIDPRKMINTEHDIAVDVRVSDIPESFRKPFLEGAIAAAESQREKADNEAAERGYEIGARWSQGVLKSLVNESDLMTVGISLDRATRMATVDLGITGQPNTDLARTLAAYGKLTPSFSSMASENSALSLVLSFPTGGSLFGEVFDAIAASLEEDQDLGDAEKKAIRRAVQIVRERGSLNAVLLVEKGAGNTPQLIGGTKIAWGDEVDKLVNDALKNSGLKLDVARHAGARIHEIPHTPGDPDPLGIGSEPEHIAMRRDSFWVSMGGDNLNGLKSVLDRLGKASAPSGSPISLLVRPAAIFTLTMKDDGNNEARTAALQRAAALVGQAGDVVKLEIAPTPTGAKLSLQAGVDLLKFAFP